MLNRKYVLYIAIVGPGPDLDAFIGVVNPNDQAHVVFDALHAANNYEMDIETAGNLPHVRVRTCQ